MTTIICPECGSKNVSCEENGIKISSWKFNSWTHADLFLCKDCKENFATGFGDWCLEKGAEVLP